MKSESNNNSATSVFHEGKFIADPLSTVNVFIGFFPIVTQKVQSKLKFSSKSFSDFLPPNTALKVDLGIWQLLRVLPRQTVIL